MGAFRLGVTLKRFKVLKKIGKKKHDEKAKIICTEV
jgi:hypothetical protein